MDNWRTMQPAEILPTGMEECGTAAADMGLPTVPAEHQQAVLAFMATHGLATFEDPRVLACGSTICPECDSHPSDRPEEWHDGSAEYAGHVAADGAVLIGCEGYHTPAFRAAYWAMQRGGLLRNT